MATYDAPKRVNNAVYNPADYNVTTISVTTTSASTGISQDDADTRYVRLNASQTVAGVKTLTSPLVLSSEGVSSQLSILNSGLNVNSDMNLATDKTLSTTNLTVSGNLSIPGGAVTGITKASIGLGNVDNTSDINKMISTATQTALNLKANIASPTFTGTVGGITKAMVGLGNVSDVASADLPISTATQTALNLKANIANPTFTGTVSGVTKSMVGLGNVSDVASADLPVSTATQTALNLKANVANPTFTGTVGGITKAMVGLGNVSDVASADLPISTATQTALNLKSNIANPTFTGTATIPNLNLSSISNTTASSVLYYNSTSKAVSYGAPSSSVAGSNTQVQYNNNGVLGASSSLTFASNILNAPSIKALSGESQISNGNYSDPDSGVARALKVSGDGLAVKGGLKTDSLQVSQGYINFGGSQWLDTSTIFLPDVAPRACLYCQRGTISNRTALGLGLPVQAKQQFLFGISNTTYANWAHCSGYVLNPSGAPAMLVNGTVPRLSGGTVSVSGFTFPAININSLDNQKVYKYELWVFELPPE